MLVEALNCVEFYRNESCGKCVPCRVGTQKLVDMLGELLAGKRQDLTPIDGLAQTMLLTAICGLGQVAANPLRTALKFFPEDLRNYVKT